MTSIRGRYEYDDDSLRPGKGRQGGLHQNLFDQDGNLRASARFIPDDPDAPAWEPVPLDAQPDELRSREREELEAFLTEVLGALLTVAVARGAPHARRLWQERAQPALKSVLSRLAAPSARRRSTPDPAEVVPLEGVVMPSEVLDAPAEETATPLTRSQARARLLAALAARAFSDEQLRLLAGAHLVDDGPPVTGHSPSELPAEDVERLRLVLEADSATLGDAILRALGVAQGRTDVSATPRTVEDTDSA